MLKLLVRKQLMEIFRMYFYDAKKNKKRSAKSVVLWFIFYFVLVVGVLGGMFGAVSYAICPALVEADMGWMFFIIMGMLGICIGAFGSVFNTYASLYLGKDNDLLLSMPIPIKDIVASRLLSVYIMGAMYSVTAIIPAIAIYWITAGISASVIICGILFTLVISVIAFILSCLLGWCVAKISLKIKNKSAVTVAVSVLFIAAYYYVYFKAQSLIENMIENITVYGTRIKGAAYGLYIFGRFGEGDMRSAAIVCASAVVCLGITWLILRNTFLSIATARGNSGSEKAAKSANVGSAKVKSPYRALVAKEFALFASNPNYMLNSGIGIAFLPVGGIALLIKGKMLVDTLDGVFAEKAGSTAVLMCALFITLASMNTMAAPSVSLEGRNIWIPKSLPVSGKEILRAKTEMHLILTLIPMVFIGVCGAVRLNDPLVTKLLVIVFVSVYSLFSSLFATFCGIKMPLLNWTNDIIPIKQGGAVAVSLFANWGMAAVFAVGFFLFGYRLGGAVYIAIWVAVTAVLSYMLSRWLDTKGARLFDGL